MRLRRMREKTMISFKLTESSEKYKKQLCDMAALGLCVLDEGGVPLSVREGDGLTLSLDGDGAVIECNCKSGVYRGVLWLSRGVTGTFKQSFELCGEMIDNSRNAVMTVEQTKRQIVYSAAFGLNCIYLYNEDTFELEGEPYFGYMRGRYSAAEMSEIASYAADFGIELVPCIQTLAHLNQALRWSCYAKIKDVDDILLADEEETYSLIEKLVAAWRKVTPSEHINIGMDEAYLLGRGKYFDKHGAVPRFELMCRHLRRVAEICAAYGFKPMMWSDMFFRLAYGGYYEDGTIDNRLIESIPQDVTLIYWDYYGTDRAHYKKQLDRHGVFKNELAFAGGAWKWSGFTPATDHSLRVSQLALEEVRRRDIKYCLVTCWGDNGADCLHNCVLPVLALYGAHNYLPPESAEANARADIFAATGYTTDELCALCKPSVTPENNRTPYANPTKYLLYNDPLMGLFDRHTTSRFPAFYAECANELSALALRDSAFSYLFDVQAKLCRALELKSTLGAELKAAYDGNDRIRLKQLAEQTIPEVRHRIEDFRKAFRTAWLKESRPAGFDVQDLRIGGLLQRLDTAAETVGDYLGGRIERIEELECERLFFDCRENAEDKCLTIGMNRYGLAATPNILA